MRLHLVREGMAQPSVTEIALENAKVELRKLEYGILEKMPDKESLYFSASPKLDTLSAGCA